MTIDAQHARGAQALHVHAVEGESAYISLSPFAPPNNSFFGRAYVWVTAFPTAPAYAHFTMIEASGTPASDGTISPLGGQYDPYGMAADFGVGSGLGPTGDWVNWNSSAPALAGQWLCLEWEMAQNEPSTSLSNVVNIWIDGIAKTSLSVSTYVHPGIKDAGLLFPTWQSIWFGWTIYDGMATPTQFDLWYDDIILSTTRVKC